MPADKSASDTPEGEISLRTVALPANSNSAGVASGGWALAQMDMAGGTHAIGHTGVQVVTAGADSIKFHNSINIGDEVCCYTRISRIGRTSITIVIEIWVRRKRVGPLLKAVSGTYTYVAVDDHAKPIEIKNKTF